jgi:CTD small phosphatase-like protein 2
MKARTACSLTAYQVNLIKKEGGQNLCVVQQRSILSTSEAHHLTAMSTMSSSTSTTTPTPSDLVIFVDLDNTMISTTFAEGVIEGLRENALTIESTGVTCYKRPFLDLFLQEISTRYAQVHVFTAASKTYADAILDKLDPNGTIFTKRWYSDSCKLAKNGRECRKNVLLLDCSPLKIDPKRFVLIDDRQENMMDHLSNGILVSEFSVWPYEIDSEDKAKNDSALVKVLELLKQLDCVEDVRPLLEKKFLWKSVKDMADLNCPVGATPI